MSKTRPPYPAAFREQMIELVRSGRTPGDLAREFEPSAQAIRTWVAQADRDAGKRTDGLSTEEREENRRLRREVRRLREERDILARATAWFARETGPGRTTCDRAVSSPAPRAWSESSYPSNRSISACSIPLTANPQLSCRAPRPGRSPPG